MKKTAEEILSQWDEQIEKDKAELEKQLGIFFDWHDAKIQKPGIAIGYKNLSPKVMVKTPLGDGTGYHNSSDNNWLVDVNGEELQSYTGVTHWKFIKESYHQEKIKKTGIKSKEFYSFVNSLDANKEYPVRYWIDSHGEKHYEWKLLKGGDLTENQIFELYQFTQQSRPKASQVEGMTAEEIVSNFIGERSLPNHRVSFSISDVVEIAEAYHAQYASQTKQVERREELIKFLDWHFGDNNSNDVLVDKYLKRQ